MDNIILRSRKNLVSGYKKLIATTFEILNKHYNVISLYEDNEINQNYKTKTLLNKSNFFSKELFISPLPAYKDQAFSLNLPDKDNINILTMWESDYLHRLGVNELNETAAKVFVPCKWNLHSFNRSKVKNLELLNLFVDDRFFNYQPKYNLKTFTFIAGANLNNYNNANSRKNINLIIDSFLRAFKNVDDVELVIKATGCDKNLLRSYIGSKINIVFDDFSDLEMRNFLASGDVFVSSSRSEGWGFFQIESLAVGRPIITINYGGIKEFCNNSNSFFIDYQEELAPGVLGKGGGSWANPNQDSLIEKMLYCYKNKDSIRHNWNNYSRSVLPQFSVNNYETRLLNILNN